MKTFALSILIALFLSAAGVVQAAQGGREVKLRINEQKAVRGSGITMKFIELVEDSRCPQGVDCIWAGNAKIKVSVSKKGKETKTFELNTGQGETDVVYEGYEILLTGLTPYPKANARIAKTSYVAAFTVTKETPAGKK